MKLSNHYSTQLTRSFTGTYRLTGRGVVFDEAKTPFLKLRLSDCEGDYVVMLNLDKTPVPERIGHLEQVTASGVKCLSGQFILDDFRKATREEVASLPMTQTIQTIDEALNSLGKLPEGSAAVYIAILASYRANLCVLEARKAG